MGPLMGCHHCFNNTLVLPILSSLFEEKWIQATIFFILMISLFMGIAIIADLFMCSIEIITSTTKKTYRLLPDSIEPQITETRIWNKTVANLTLMALGSSAPEILLATIETIGNGFTAGDLGPGAIVGASAFNLFVITAVCVIAIPKNESKRINEIKVFGVSSFFNVFAYVWLYLVLKVITPDEVNVTEAVFTLLFFPLMVFCGYAADRNFFRDNKWQEFGEKIFSNGEVSEKNLSKFIKEIRKIDGSVTEEECEQLAKVYIFSKQNHSQMFYRISAIRLLSASNSPIPQLNERLQRIYDTFTENLSKSGSGSKRSDSNGTPFKIETQLSVESVSGVIEEKIDPTKAVLSFVSESVSVKESDSQIEICVQRKGLLNIPVLCEVQTIDRTAVANSEYKPIKELIAFAPNQTLNNVFIQLLSDREWSPDKVFLVKLNLPNNQINKCVIKGRVSIMQITIVDDNEPGIVEFVQSFLVVSNNQTMADIPLIRYQGSDGEVRVRWKTIDGSAVNGRHFYGGEGEVIFEESVTKKVIQIPINLLDEERDEYFFEIVLIESTAGGMIGRLKRVMVTITDDQNYDNTMKKILPKLNSQNSLILHRDEWLDQFKDAFAFGSGDESGEEMSALAYVLHFFSFGWKVLFAFIPPTRMCAGWLTFFCSLGVIGILTTMMGDFASAFGCLVGLSDHVTALTFVALGTSMPDLFASRTAAVREKYADNAIGNVFGSNAFNVFLGLGLPWFVATIYHAANGTKFEVQSDSLEFSVTLFIILAIIYTAFLLIRRNFRIFGFAELGGPRKYAVITFFILISFWILYIGLSIWWDFTQ